MENPAGASDIVLLCDHASNHVPACYSDLGLGSDDLERHIAWDPGALAVAHVMMSELDAPLAFSTVSRLVIDCNRPLDSAQLIVAESEGTRVPGNEDLSADARAKRIAAVYDPYHDSVDALLARRDGAGKASALVSVHSFTPTFAGKARPWHVGIVFGRDRRLSDPVLAGLREDGTFVVGENEPYSPADEVYWTLERHAESQGRPCVMFELRSDVIATHDQQIAWGKRLAVLLGRVMETLSGDVAGATH